MIKGPGYFLDEDEGLGLGQVFVPTSPWRPEFADLMRSLGLQVLRLSDSAGWKEQDISFIKELDFLRGIEVYNWDVRDIRPIFTCAKLKYVAINSSYNTPAEFQLLPDLEACKLNWRESKVTGLLNCQSLRFLNVSDFPEVDLSLATTLPSLRRLKIQSKALQTLDGLEKMANLEILELAICPKLSNVFSLVTCENLRTLELYACKRVTRLPNTLSSRLKRIAIDDCGEIESLLPLKRCMELEYVSFVGSTNIVDGNLSFLAALSVLKDVHCGKRRHYSLSCEDLRDELKRR